ncbi:MAG: polysaccharide lyase 8 family protein [Mariniphaga sp.]
MKKLLTLFILCSLINLGRLGAAIPFQPDSGIELLRKNFKSNILKNLPTEEQIGKILALLRPDGSFSDIDYSDRTRGGWKLSEHLSRLFSMSISWKSPQSTYFQSPKLKMPLFSVLDYWLKNDFINPNWWYPEIGVPKVLGQILVLLKDDLSEREIADGLKIMDRSKISRTGQNKVWLAENVIYRSLLTNDSKQIELAVQSITEEIIITTNEGIQPDFSFHQHGPQQQFGNYGLAYAGDMTELAIVFGGTPYAFATEKLAILRNYLLEGLKWVTYKNKFDISACGRQLFPNAQVGKARSLSSIYQTFAVGDQEFKTHYQSAMEDFEGNIHFNRSDMTIHRRKDFYTSVKMASNRVAGAESCNSENIQGYYMGDGATFFYQSGDEYLDIFPFWDWKKIPGITTYQDDRVLPVLTASGYKLKTDFVGGVSDGKNGVAAMQYTREGVSAFKSWFYFDDAFVCLGSGINTDQDKVVTTSVNQSLLKGEVLVAQKGRKSVQKSGSHDLENVDWIIHDKWGYYFPGSAAIKLENRERTGAWSRVVEPMSDKVLNTNIFQLWFDHGNKPKDATYAYFVFPKASAGNIDKRGGELKITTNTKAVQAVTANDKNLTGIVFFKSGLCQVSPVRTISADKPCIVLLDSHSGKETICISDPTQLQSEIKLTLTGKSAIKTGGEISFDPGKNLTTILVRLPQGGEAGKSVYIK